jgi:hypothetical protein
VLAQLKIKLRKCEFGCRQTKFLGYIVSAEGVKMSDEKVQKVLDFPTPVNARKARSFNGLSGYFSDFVPGYALSNSARKTRSPRSDDPRSSYGHRSVKIKSQIEFNR